MEINLNL